MLRDLATRVALVLAVAVTAVPAARAADQTILGNELVVRNPSTPDKREVVATAREARSPHTIVGDPRVAGASLAIMVNGGTPSAQTFGLPAGTSRFTGRPFWSGDAVKGFKYKDSKCENGPVKVAQLKKSGTGMFQIKAVAVGKLGAIAVVPPNPGTDGCVWLKVGGGGDTYHVRFGAAGQVTNDGAKVFKVLKPVVEGTCPPPTTTTTMTTTTTTTSTTTTTWPQGTTMGITIQSGGLTRTYSIRIPPGYDGTVAVPLVLDFHGSTANGQIQEAVSGFRELGDANGFIVAYPDGYHPGPLRNWNAGTCCDPAVADGVDDVGFARAVVADIASKANIDPLRVYATGLSSGGGMAHRLGCEAADVFAAVAPVAFPLNLDPLTACQPVRPISVLHFAGLTDEIIPYDGGEVVCPTCAPGGQVFVVPSALGKLCAGRGVEAGAWLSHESESVERNSSLTVAARECCGTAADRASGLTARTLPLGAAAGGGPGRDWPAQRG